MARSSTKTTTHHIMLEPAVGELIAAHAGQAYPDECCGFLFGSDDGVSRRITGCRAVSNQWEPNERRRRFLITADDVRQAEQAAAKNNSEVVGFYHSHPDAPAIPSTFDRQHAWPWYSYLIVSVVAGHPSKLTGWELRADRSAYVQSELQTTGTDRLLMERPATKTDSIDPVTLNDE